MCIGRRKRLQPEEGDALCSAQDCLAAPDPAEVERQWVYQQSRL